MHEPLAQPTVGRPQRCRSAETARPVAVPSLSASSGLDRAMEPCPQPTTPKPDHRAAMGRYAAALSRELHQPLTSLAFDAEAALRWLDRPQADLSEAIRGLERIRDSALRAAAIARSLHSLVQHAEPSLTPVLIEDLLEAALRITAKDLERHRIAVDKEAPTAPKHVRADPAQLQQVLLVLIGTAVDAMAAVVDADADADRRLTVKVFHLEDAVHCSIGHSGAVMDAVVLRRTFEPFFPGSPDGKDLGLAISRAIVEAHGGELTAHSEPGIGSSLSFRLGLAE